MREINLNIDYITSLNDLELENLIKTNENLGGETLSLINEFTNNTNVLCAIAEHENTKVETLISLTSMRNKYINIFLVNHINLPKFCLQLIAENDDVAGFVAQINLNCISLSN